MTDGPPPELRQRLRKEPTLWVRNYLRHPEDPTRPYDFYDGSGDKFIHYLTDEAGPMNPENWGNINILLFARGCLKTFTCTALAAWSIDSFPTLEVAATAPRDDQRYEVVDRFKEKAEQSGLVDLRVKNKLSHQKFRHQVKDGETGEVHTSYSHLKSRSAWGEGTALRGIHAHEGIIDEAQHVDEGTFSTFATEAVDRSVPEVDFFPTIFIIGTPEMANTFFHRLWQMAEKRDWDQDNTEWTYEGEGDEFLPTPLADERDQLREAAEAEEAAGNARRAQELNEQADDISGFTVQGWHVDQYNSPLHDPASIAFKKQTYSKKKYENEVLANFYSPENDLIVNDDVWRALDADLGWNVGRRSDDSLMVMGVDWGGGEGEGAASTVVSIGEFDEESETMEVRLIDVFDSGLSFDGETEQIDAYMQNFDIDVAVVDEGYGDSERQHLQDEYGWRNLYGCWYGNVKDKETVKWNRHKNQKRFFTCSKQHMVRQFSEDFKSGHIIIPKQNLDFGSKHDLGTQIVEQLTAPYTDRDETVSGKKKLKVMSDRSDDIFDAFTYMWIAANKVTGGRTLKEIGSHTMPGY